MQFGEDQGCRRFGHRCAVLRDAPSVLAVEFAAIGPLRKAEVTRHGEMGCELSAHGGVDHAVAREAGHAGARTRIASTVVDVGRKEGGSRDHRIPADAVEADITETVSG